MKKGSVPFQKSLLRVFIISLASFSLMAFFIPRANAIELYVDPNGKDPYGNTCYTSIQTAIDASNNGDEIIIEPGIYYENINFSGKAIIVRSHDHTDPDIVSATVVDGGKAGSVIVFDSGEGNGSVLSGITVRNGKSSLDGGGILCESSSPIIENCTIVGNSTTNGGGIFCKDSLLKVINCLILKNSATNGGGIFCKGSSPSIINCTFTKNSASWHGVGIYSDNYSSPTVMNCILWDDSPSVKEIFGDNLTVRYSDIQGGYQGAGNINDYPVFINPDIDDYHLWVDSPCIDAGNSEGAPLFDKEGVSRPIGSGYDIGAYEFKPGITHYISETQSIQEAINNANISDVIILEPGIYYENIDFLGKPITLRSIDPNDPNIVASTIIDANGGVGVSFGNREKSFCTLLAGITVQNGSNGIRCTYFASPTIKNCVIKKSLGHAIICYSTYPKAEHPKPIIKKCMIIDNSRLGIFCDTASPVLEDSEINNNKEGGVRLKYGSLMITNCIVSENLGHGIYCFSNTSTIANCDILKNMGNGIHFSALSFIAPIIENCNIIENYGSGIDCDVGCRGSILNCTIVGNISKDGAGINNYGGRSQNTKIQNCIIRDNIPEEINDQTGVFNVTNSCVLGGYGDPNITNNINEDPLFVNASTGDFHLLPDSPCIDAGKNDGAPDYDRDGMPRPRDGNKDGEAICDMGAYEFPQDLCYLDWDADGHGDPLSQIPIGEQGHCPEGYVYTSGDCNDQDPNINPDAIEIPDNCIDDNCDGIGDPNCCNFEFLSAITSRSKFGEPSVYLGISQEEIRKQAPPCPPGPSFCITLIDPDNYTSYFKDQRLCQRDFVLYHWIVKIEKVGYVSPNDYPFLAWSPDELPQKEGYRWMLIKGESATGEILVFDMTDSDSYQVKVEDGECFSIVWTNDISYTLHLQKGWNMISLPVVPNNSARSAVFPQALAMWHFDPSQMMYVYIEEDDPMQPCIGYWVLVDQEMDHVLSGSPVTQCTLGLKQTWNMVGALFDQTSISLSQGSIEALYGFRDGSYYLLGNMYDPVLESGMGYWILPSAECVLSANII